MDYCDGNNHFNFGVGRTQNGQLAAILDFCYTHINISKTTLNSQMLEQLMEHVWYIMPRLCHTLFPYLKNLL